MTPDIAAQCADLAMAELPGFKAAAAFLVGALLIGMIIGWQVRGEDADTVPK